MEWITTYFDKFVVLLNTPILGENSITMASVFGFVLIVVFAWWLSSTVERLLQRMTMGRSYRHIDDSTFYLISRLLRYIIWITATLVGLSYIGFNLTGLAFIGGAIGVGIGFGLQNIVSNFVSGIILILEKSLKIGDFIEVASGTAGIVNEIGLRYTRITTRDNVDILVPNSEFVNGQVTNWSFNEKFRRIHVPFGVAYGTDKELVKVAALKAAANVEGIIANDPGRLPQVWLTEFGDSSLNFELVVWVGNDLMSRPAGTKAMLLWEIHTQLDEHGIEIPFPQRDLHIRSGRLKVVLERDSDDRMSD